MQTGRVLPALALVTGVADDRFVGQRLDVVGTMATGAGERTAVNASPVLFGLPVVAHAAINGFDDLVVKVFTFQIDVTGDALEIAVK